MTVPLTVAEVGCRVTGGPVAAPGRSRIVQARAAAAAFPAASCAATVNWCAPSPRSPYSTALEHGAGGPSSRRQLKRTPVSLSLNANRALVSPLVVSGASSIDGAGGGVASIVHSNSRGALALPAESAATTAN